MKEAVRISSCVLVGLLTACGGGGGGGGGGGLDRLTGSLSVPNLAAGGSGDRVGGGLDGEAAIAERVGTLAAAERKTLRGEVAPDTDLQDVMRLGLTGRLQLDLEFVASGDSTAYVFEIASGREVARLTPGTRRSLNVGVNELDLVVAAGSLKSTYQLRLQATALVEGTLDLPMQLQAVSPRSAVQARYLGSHHPMTPGEVVVLRSPGTVALDVPGCVKTAASKGPIEVYRIVGPTARKTLVQGADPAESLELETALVAKRASALPGVRAASPNYTYQAMAEPNDQHYGLQWHYKQIRMPQAWDVTQGSSNVIVGVLDTGIVLGHPDLSSRLTNTGYDFISNASNALDGDGIDNNPDDPGSGGGSVPSSFHGTHVAGTIGADSNNGVGTAGVDWNCRLMPLRALGKGGSGTLADIANGILYSAGLPNSTGAVPTKRCDVLNMSLGGPGSASVLDNACRDAANAGVLLIAAAGNDNASTLNYPASYASVLSVGAVGFDRTRAPYSNFASNIDIWAPGGNQAVDQNGDNYGDGVLSSMAEGFASSRSATYSFSQGTSMACPHIAGVAALILSVRPVTSLADLRSILQTNSQPGSNLPNGGVLVDAHAAVVAAKGGSSGGAVVTPTPTSLVFEGTVTSQFFSLENRGSSNLTLVGAKSGVSYSPGASGWVTSATPSGTAGNIDVTRVDVVVDRTGLANGLYEAEVVLVFDDSGTESTTRVPITLRVGQPSSSADTVFVLLVDINTLDTLYQTSTDNVAGFAYAVDQVAAGEYLLVAGTDRDNDDFLGDEGELFGVWPSSDTPEILSVTGSAGQVGGLDFSLAGVVTLSNPSRKRQTYRLLKPSGPGR